MVRSSARFHRRVIPALGTFSLTALIIFGCGGGGVKAGGPTSLSGAVVARASIDQFGDPGVTVSWHPNDFLFGNKQIVDWQIFRGGSLTPSLVTLGPSKSAVDSSGYPNGFAWTNFNGLFNVEQCSATALNNANVASTSRVVPGVPVSYRVQLIYADSSVDYPESGSRIVTTGSSGGSTDGGFPPQPPPCYYASHFASSSGTATPLNPPTLARPRAGQNAAEPLRFIWSSSEGSPTIPLAYALQLSSDFGFAAGDTYTFPEIVSSSSQNISSPLIAFTASYLPPTLKTAKTIYWRVGVKNPTDVPGPVPDRLTNLAYIFSDSQSFSR